MNLLTTPEMAKILRISESGLRKLVRRGKIPYIRLGARTIRFDPEAITRWRISFFEIDEGDQKDGVNQKARLQELDISMQYREKKMEQVNRGIQQEESRSQNSQVKTLGPVAARTAEQLLEAEDINCSGSQSN